MPDLVFFPVDWSGADVPAGAPDDPDPDMQYRVRAFGKTPDGREVDASIDFYPYFFVGLPAEWSDARQRAFVAECELSHGAVRELSRPVTRTTLWGFTGNAPRPFAQLAFRTAAAARRARYKLNKSRKTYEACVDPVIRFFHVRRVSPAAWVVVAGAAVAASPDRIVARADFRSVSPVAADAVPRGPPPLVFASWDIEVYSDTGAFPLASRPGDKIIQIATTFKRYGDAEPYLRTVVALGTCDDVPGVEIVPVPDEPAVVNAWIDLLRRERTDVLLGYNTHQFDWKYVYGRSVMALDDVTAEPAVRLERLGKDDRDDDDDPARDDDDSGTRNGRVRELRLSSGAYGDNSFFTLETPGMLQIDVLQVMRREHKLESYSLNAVSARFLGDAKVDLPAAQIFAKFRGSAADRADVARYAVKDTELPLRLVAKLSVFENLAEMANATAVPVDYLLNRGQQIKAFSLVLRKARDLGFVCPDDESFPVAGKYDGATVLDAKRGAYFDVVSGLDFASLYPSIMRAWNLCYSTLVLDDAFRDLPGVRYHEVVTDLGTFTFAIERTPDGGDAPGPDGGGGDPVPSVLPALLADLATYRSRAKKNMAAAKTRGDDFAAAVFNGQQLAYKVSMNSIYGFCGASKGFLPCVPIAASVTATGRLMIERTKRLAESLVPGSRVVYGDTDSVMVVFDVGADRRHDLAAHFEVATRVAKEVSATFRRPIELEFEKCYYPYLLFSKKRYSGLMYTRPDAPDYIDTKGIQLVRRDNCPLVKDVSTRVLEAIMRDKDPGRAVDAARDVVRGVIRGAYPIDKFVVSKTLRTGYKNAMQPHVIVADKILRRRGYPVNSGERVPYVFVRGPYDAKQSEKAEDPAWATDNGLDLDVLYYVTNQIRSPVTTLLELFVDDVDAEVFDFEDIGDALAALRRKEADDTVVAKRARRNAVARQREITTFFRPVS